MTAPTAPNLGGPYGPNGNSTNPALKLHLKAGLSWALSATGALRDYATQVLSHAQDIVAAEAQARQSGDEAIFGLNRTTGPFANDAAAASTVVVGGFYYDTAGIVRRRMV